MRLFVGIALPTAVSDLLQQIRQQLEPRSGPDLRWSAPEGWHVTLQFLGAVNDECAACVCRQLKTIAAPAVAVRLEGLGFFERAGVFWAGVALTPPLLALQQFVTAAMRNCRFTPEDRPYDPHITLARAKARGGSKAVEPLKNIVDKSKLQLRAEFIAREFLLYESFPGPEGSRYEIRARFPLNSNP
jgi:2'-5' RNA ligase